MNQHGAVIALAGASGDLGGRIARALVARGADVLALVRPGTPMEERALGWDGCPPG